MASRILFFTTNNVKNVFQAGTLVSRAMSTASGRNIGFIGLGMLRRLTLS